MSHEKRRRILSFAFLAAVALAGFFAVRLVLHTVYWADPAHRDQPLAGWMTPRYVAHSWHVPPEVVEEALGLSQDGPRRRMTLEDIAGDNGVPLPELEQQVLNAIQTFKASRD